MAQIDDMIEGVRTVANEIDYSQKDAARTMIVS